MQANIGTARIYNSKCEKLLGIKVDYKLSFDDHIGNIYKKADAKLNALARVAQYMNTEKIMNVFLSQFNYCPLHGCSTICR